MTSNVAPKLLRGLPERVPRAAISAARSNLHDKLMPLHEALFVETNPGPVKYAASRLGLCKPDTRLPLAPVSEQTKAIVDAALEKVGLLTRDAA